MRVTVIGQGYVGLTVAIGAAEVGHDVVGLDLDKELIENLLKGITFIPGITEKSIKKLIKRDKYFPSTDLNSMKGSEVLIIAVPTPLTPSRKPDLKYLESASVQIANIISEKALIINESTSYPGTLRNYIKPKIESISNVEFLYASAPERIDPGNNMWKLSNTPRIIGGLTQEASKKALELYKTFCSEVYEVSSPEVAEASKLFENSFRQINIALANEFSKISSAIGFSTNEAIKAAATKPFGFMPFFPSIGVGGHCIPVDPSYLSYAAAKAGVQARFIELANETNRSMAKYVVEKISTTFGFSLEGKKVQVAGIAYKPGVSDLRESPALDLINELKMAGAKVVWHDPLVLEYNDEKSQVLDCSVDFGLIVTPHAEIDFSEWRKGGTTVLDLSANSNDYGWAKFL
jgi:UDP-N-acetyl-D-glucosamine dehydrogenase